MVNVVRMTFALPVNRTGSDNTNSAHKNVAPLQQITAAFPYHWPLTRLVQQFKYHRQLTLAAPLARLMHRYLPPLSPDFAPDFWYRFRYIHSVLPKEGLTKVLNWPYS